MSFDAQIVKLIKNKELDAAWAFTMSEEAKVGRTPQILNYQAILMSQMGHYTKSVQLYKELIPLISPNASIYNNYGVSLRHTDKGYDAIKVFKKAIQLKPNYYEAMKNLATTFSDMKKNEEGI